MPGKPAAYIPWPDIRMRWEAGDSYGEIAKIFPVTREGVRKRCLREGWRRVGDPGDDRPTDANDVVGVSPTLNVAPWLPWTEGSKPLGTKDSPIKRAEILACLSEGMSYRATSGFVMISEDTFRDWREADSAFSAQCRFAQQAWHRKKLQVIERSDNPDLALRLLERNPATRQDYRSAEVSKGSGGVSITLNMPRPGQLEPPTIDLDPPETLESDQ